MRYGDEKQVLVFEMSSFNVDNPLGVGIKYKHNVKQNMIIF